MKNTEFYYLALKESETWEHNKQYLIPAQNWQDAVNTANAVSLINNIEVRLSTTQGFNNQGHYFYNVLISN